MPEQKRVHMKITSPAFANNGRIPEKYTCDMESLIPPLEFVDVPSQAQSLVLIMDDPDAPSGTFVHWVVYNINPKVVKVEEGKVPEGGIQGATNAGTQEYVGPCPPSGTHRYFFKLYALNKQLELPQGITKQQVLEKMQDSVIAQAQLLGLYSRK